MAEAKRILILSNGHGEDEMGSLLAVKLREIPGVSVTAMAIVGEGHAYSREGIPLVGPRRRLPSEGFGFNSLKNLLRDLRAGLLGLTYEQTLFLRKVAPDFDWVVGVGDILLVWFNARCLHKPMVFLPTAKSNYIEPHFEVEVKLMKENCVAVFPRDEVTAEDLRSRGVSARYLGNLMMDCLKFTGEDFGLGFPENKPSLWPWQGMVPPRDIVIGILPGSRMEAYENLMAMTAACRLLDGMLETKAHFLVAWPSHLDYNEILRYVVAEQIRFVKPKEEEREKGIVAWVWYYLTRFPIVVGHFADILRVADIVLGLAGTANEQAVGLGKPVVSFVGKGPQYNTRFAKRQKKLLGEALSLVPSEPLTVAHEMWDILRDEERYRRMAAVGRERMGQPGGADRVVREIRTLLGV